MVDGLHNLFGAIANLTVCRDTLTEGTKWFG
jgi:hypothetical protein